ncbi:MAG: hypothetical protein BWY05_00309 [Euryarchaeota archaeon ADurb.Bin165]|jgi:hypothetical protein|nr:MAG: hypothetical protein BWY05_00309 [Euryarchaeota archaeon ADurb.Bin165]
MEELFFKKPGGIIFEELNHLCLDGVVHLHKKIAYPESFWKSFITRDLFGAEGRIYESILNSIM